MNFKLSILVGTMAAVTCASAGAQNNVTAVGQFPGATADAQINACLAAIPGGGVCDARGFGYSSQTIASTVTIGANQTVLFSHATKLQPQSASTPTSMFVVEPDGDLEGAVLDCEIVSTPTAYSGAFVANDPTKNYGATASMPSTTNNTVIRDLSSTQSCESDPYGYFVSITANAGVGVFQISLDKIHPNGLEYGLYLSTLGASSAFINGLHVVDFRDAQSIYGVYMNAGGYGQIASNVFDPATCEAGGQGTNPVQSCWFATGLTGGLYTAFISGNQWFGNMWDYNAGIKRPFDQDTTAVRANSFTGQFDGTPVDATGGNYFRIDPLYGAWHSQGFEADFASYFSPLLVSSNGSSSGVGCVWLANGSGWDTTCDAGPGFSFSAKVAVPSLAGSGTATFTPGAAAGTGATAVCATSHACDSVSGTVTLTTGTGTTTGTLATVTLPITRGNQPNCMVTTESASAMLASNTWTESATAITIAANAALTASTAYTVKYFCGGN